MRLHGGLSHAEPGLCCLLPLDFPFPPSALGWHKSVRDSVSQFSLLILLKISWFSSHPNKKTELKLRMGVSTAPSLQMIYRGLKLVGDPTLKKLQAPVRTGTYEETRNWKHGQEMVDSVLESPGRG